MSDRNFDVNASGLAGEGVEPVIFAMMDLVGEPQFLHSSVGAIPWGGEEWYGLGTFGDIESIKDQMGSAPARFRVSLYPVAAEYLSDAINENTWGRLFELYLGNWDGSALVRDPDLLLRGRMGPPEILIGGSKSSISLVVEDIRGALDRVNGKRATMLDHQVEAPGDTFYSWLPTMMDHRFVFNGRQMSPSGPVTGGAPTPEPWPGYNDQFLFPFG